MGKSNDEKNINGKDVYNSLYDNSLVYGGTWTHPIYRRGGARGGFLTARLMKKGIKKLTEIGSKVAKGLGKEGLSVALDAGTQVISGADPKEALKQSIKKRKGEIVKKFGHIIKEELKRKKGAGRRYSLIRVKCKKRKRQRAGSNFKNKRLSLRGASNQKRISII